MPSNLLLNSIVCNLLQLWVKWKTRTRGDTSATVAASKVSKVNRRVWRGEILMLVHICRRLRALKSHRGDQFLARYQRFFSAADGTCPSFEYWFGQQLPWQRWKLRSIRIGTPPITNIIKWKQYISIKKRPLESDLVMPQAPITIPDT